jgi:hypothetical protein
MGIAAHVRARLTRSYGGSPLHLIGHLALPAIAVYAFSRIAGGLSVVAWVVAGAMLHDLVLLPLYSLLDRGARAAVGVRAINHVRVPAAIAGVLLLVWLPLILGRSRGAYEAVAGHPPEGYATRWLLITAGLFAASALLYGLRAVAGGRRRRRTWGRP